MIESVKHTVAIVFSGINCPFNKNGIPPKTTVFFLPFATTTHRERAHAHVFGDIAAALPAFRGGHTCGRNLDFNARPAKSASCRSEPWPSLHVCWLLGSLPYLGFAGLWANVDMSSSAGQKRKRSDPSGPAYSYRPGGHVGPSCSGSDDFCFLCQFSSGDGSVENKGFTEEIRVLALQLAKEKKELPIIVSAVARAYNEGIKDLVTWTNARGEEIQSPAWTRESITRHLTFSGQFPLFNESVSQIFHALIVAEQSAVMNPVTGGVHTEKKTELLKTIASYGKWLETQNRCQRKEDTSCRAV